MQDTNHRVPQGFRCLGVSVDVATKVRRVLGSVEWGQPFGLCAPTENMCPHATDL